MAIVEITRRMLRAARSLTGLSQQELADRASISRPCLTAWEDSSGSVPNAGSSLIGDGRFRSEADMRPCVASTHEVAPKVELIAALLNGNNPFVDNQTKDLEEAHLTHLISSS